MDNLERLAGRLNRSGRYLFAVAWLVFGIQHYMYAEFVKDLVPAFMPARLFWTYFTGTAMIAAGIAIILGRQLKLTATLVGVMLVIFILLLHVPGLIRDPHTPISWTRAFEDIVLAGAAFLLAGKTSFMKIARYLFALPLIPLGIGHFMRLSFVAVPVPDYLPGKVFWDYLVGVSMIVAAGCILINKWAERMSVALGTILLLFTGLDHVPALVVNIYNGMEWTGAFLDVAITGGVFILAERLQKSWPIRLPVEKNERM